MVGSDVKRLHSGHEHGDRQIAEPDGFLDGLAIAVILAEQMAGLVVNKPLVAARKRRRP
jgi:hypothetical protein